jgi:NTE family protein
LASNKGIAVVLSGGAARCIAQLGVMQALEEMKIPVSAISGVSGGAIVGAFLANNYSPQQTLKIIKDTSLLKIIRPAWDSAGILKMDKAEKIYSDYFKFTKFEELPFPLHISACDVNTGEYVIFSKGNLIKAVIASSSFPPVFKPYKHAGRELIDGGIVNNLPVEPVLGYEKIIGVNINIINSERDLDSLYKYFERTVDIIVTSNITASRNQCHLIIEPPEMKQTYLSDIGKADEMFAIGYDYTLSLKKKITELIKN